MSVLDFFTQYYGWYFLFSFILFFPYLGILNQEIPFMSDGELLTIAFLSAIMWPIPLIVWLLYSIIK